MADLMLSARTINFDGRRSSWERKVTTYTLATAGGKYEKPRGEQEGSVYEKSAVGEKILIDKFIESLYRYDHQRVTGWYSKLDRGLHHPSAVGDGGFSGL